VRFIEEHQNHRVGRDGLRWGVESICAVLSEHGCVIAPSTYYDARRRAPSRRALRDEQLKVEITRVYEDNHQLFGARKVWLILRGQGIDVARCTVERLMRQLGIEGVRRGAKRRTTIPDEQHERPADLVERNFDPLAPNRLWVADFTYVATWSGTCYVAFVIDAFSRRVLGWRAAISMHTELVLDTLEMAIWTRAQAGVTDLTGLVHHTDAGSQYTSIAFTTRLIQAGVDASVGSVGDAYDNALAETTVGLFKTEWINRRGPWRNLDHVEIATLEWVDWYNHRRPHEAIDDFTPVAVEDLHYAHITALTEVGGSTP
jgi:putative transposase